MLVFIQVVSSEFRVYLRRKISVGIDLKELGEGVRCRNVWNFAQGLNLEPIFTQNERL